MTTILSTLMITYMKKVQSWKVKIGLNALDKPEYIDPSNPAENLDTQCSF
ncbi:hypothetical protein PZB74_12295 [Porifericola rhodea]|nr:hypothetical protein [Porifericola rhodea]WKN29746.1 hypothetical protein PZB74_12295 [Porifericola rhodea]